MMHTCHNHAPRNPKPADGWTPEGRRAMRAQIPHWLPVECGHLTAESDPECSGCRWRGWKRHDD